MLCLQKYKVWILVGWVPLLTAFDVFSAMSFFLAMQSGCSGISSKTTGPTITSSNLSGSSEYPFISDQSIGASF